MELRTRAGLALALAASLSAAAHAGVVVNDTWIDGNRNDPAAPVYSENGVDLDGDGNLESAWFQGGGGTLDPVGPGGPLAGVLGATGSSSWTTYFTDEANPVTLAAAGDSMKVTWRFTPVTVNAANTSQNFRIALVDSPSAARLAANGTPGAGAYTGYSIFGNMAQTLGNSNPFQLRERTANPGSGFLTTSGDWTALANGATSGAAGYAGGTEYTLEWTLTRNAANGLDISVVMSGGTLNNTGSATVNFTDATPGGFSFDTFGLRPSDAATTAAEFNTSLFRVEFTPVPEPATLGLALGGLAALAARRRR